MAKKSQPVIPDGILDEQNDTLFFMCNRPLSFTEHVNLIAKIQLEEQRVGRKIIIVPHAVDVVKS